MAMETWQITMVLQQWLPNTPLPPEQLNEVVGQSYLRAIARLELEEVALLWGMRKEMGIFGERGVSGDHTYRSSP